MNTMNTKHIDALVPRRLHTDSPTYAKRLAAFRALDRQFPEVYALFRTRVREAVAAGVTRCSARGILALIRWHHDVIEGRVGGSKINDHCAPFYVRKLIAEEPALAGFFELRGEDDGRAPGAIRFAGDGAAGDFASAPFEALVPKDAQVVAGE